MEATEVERELDELETRIERLRALYEQHFMGLEKLEPLIPRKDVDRRIWILRREQIRNTGLRFKFQMLIQRYNTFQQYWGRILREIENGTYRRDVVRAAKRFGAQEALTILGRRRAQKYADLAAVQEAKRGGASKEIVEELPDDLLEDEPLEPELLGDDDLEEDIEDADSLSLSDIEDESPTPVARSWKSTPAPAPSWLAPPSERGHAPLPPATPPPSPSPPAVDEKKPIAIPLPRPTDPDAAKRRLAELAAQRSPARGDTPVAETAGGPLDLDLDFDGPRTAAKSSKSSPRRASSNKIKAVKPAASGATAPTNASPTGGSGARRPSTRAMRIRAFIAAPPPRASSPGPESNPRPPASPQAAPPPPPPPEPASVPVEPARPRERAHPQSPQDRAQSGLDEARLRQIYTKYIETRRSANEPTAGITFEKLAESLRVQASKLRESHAVTSVDYDVVVKNGKTLIKPILK